MGYLAMLSWPMFLMMLVAIVIGTVIQYIARGYGLNGFTQAREAKMSCKSITTRLPKAPRNCAFTARVVSACLCQASRAPHKNL